MKNTIIFLVQIFYIIYGFSQPVQWESRGIGGGGALFSPSINPLNLNEMYLSCDMSQTFHSIDRGLHWDVIPFQQIQGGHDGYVSFTKDPNIRYTLHYQSTNGNDYIKPMQSIDGGKTWTVLSGNPYPLSPNGFVMRLFADFDNPNRVILADYGTIYFSSDGGKNFTQIHTNISSGSGNHIAGVFWDNNDIYIGTNDGIIHSSNNGTSFSTMSVSGIGSGEYILGFSGARKNGSVKFACLTSTSVWAGYQFGSNYYGAMKGIYTMENANGVWTSTLSGITVGTDFPVFVGMASNCTDTVYISGGSKTSAPIVMRSVNGGPWTHIFLTAGNQNIFTGWAGTGGDHAWSFPEAPFGFEVNQKNAQNLVFSDYSCVHVTFNGGNTWSERYTDSSNQNAKNSNTPIGKKYHGIGLENTTNWQIMWLDSSKIFSAFSDINGVCSDDKGLSWKFIPNLTQNSIYRIVKSPDATLYAATSSVHDMYQTTRIYDAQINAGKGGIWFSKDNGTSFKLLHDFAHPVVWIAMDPNNPEKMYASVLHSNKTAIGGIWATSNLSAGNASIWTKLPNPARCNGHPYNITVLNDGNLVVSFSARKPTSGSQFTDSSGVFYFNAKTNQWIDKSHPNMKWYTKDVVVDPNDATGATWYACVFSGWGSAVPAGTGGVYKTSDTGKTWKQISNSYRADGITIMPGNASIVYFSTETDGLFYSSNADQTNPTFSKVNSYPFRHPMRIFFNPYNLNEVWVSSFGNGMMVGNVNQSKIKETNVKTKNDISIFPNPTTGAFWLKNMVWHSKMYCEVFNLQGKLISKTELQAPATILNDVYIPSAFLKPGIYFYKIDHLKFKVVIE